MTTNHIDQLTEWYESAERITKTNLPGEGDFIIYPHRGGIGYIIERSEGGWASDIVLPDEPCRILSRAPKPKPAWHDAVAVMARFPNMAEGYRELMIRDEAHTDTWHSDHGYGYTEDLRDVTPLIEAKVTDEMVEAARQEAKDRTGVYWERSLVSRMLAAALGLETE